MMVPAIAVSMDSSAASMVSFTDFLRTPAPVAIMIRPNTPAIPESSHLASYPIDWATYTTANPTSIPTDEYVSEQRCFPLASSAEDLFLLPLAMAALPTM